MIRWSKDIEKGLILVYRCGDRFVEFDKLSTKCLEKIKSNCIDRQGSYIDALQSDIKNELTKRDRDTTIKKLLKKDLAD